MSIQVKKLTKTYGSQDAIHQLNFQVGKGEICGFLGPNGAGKTTTMKILSCFTSSTSGQAIVNGFDVEIDPFQVRKDLGYLPEHNPLYRNMYIKEYLYFVARLFHVPDSKKRVKEMIELTGLGREQHKHIRALSKGYRQRVGLAQAMIHDPAVLILDEPTSGLDPNQLMDIRALITEIGKNKTVLFSSHIMQEVEAICDRIIIVDKGKLVADDSKEVLRQKLQGRLCVQVEFENEITLSELKKINGVVEIETSNKKSFLIWTSGQKDIRKELFLYASQNQKIILEMKQTDMSVENIFQQLTTSS